MTFKGITFLIGKVIFNYQKEHPQTTSPEGPGYARVYLFANVNSQLILIIQAATLILGIIHICVFS